MVADVSTHFQWKKLYYAEWFLSISDHIFFLFRMNQVKTYFWLLLRIFANVKQRRIHIEYTFLLFSYFRMFISRHRHRASNSMHSNDRNRCKFHCCRIEYISPKNNYQFHTVDPRSVIADVDLALTMYDYYKKLWVNARHSNIYSYSYTNMYTIYQWTRRLNQQIFFFKMARNTQQCLHNV